MFTVKIIDGGSELGKEIRGWFYVPASPVTSNDGQKTPYLSLFIGKSYKDDDSCVENIYNGDIYIMNDNGKTVADYHLNKEPNIVASGSE